MGYVDRISGRPCAQLRRFKSTAFVSRSFDLQHPGISEYALRLATRASDLVIRYGGDEFAVIAPETGSEEYPELCMRITDTVRDLDIATSDGTRIPLTVSVGGVIADDPAGSPPRRIEGLLAAADRSLYRAKTSGRNCAAPAMDAT